MAKSLNRVTLLGNLGADPEFRTTPNGQSVATLNLATTYSYKDKNGEWKEVTDWHRLVCWERMAEIARDYLNKGSKVYVEGKLRNRSYEDKDGITKYITEVILSELILLSPKDTLSTDSKSGNSNYDSNVEISESHINESMVDDLPF